MHTRRPRFGAQGWAALVIVLLSSAALAEDKSPEVAAADAQNPAPINTFEVEGGYRWNYRPGREKQSWLRIAYKGALVREEGTPFKNAQALDLASPASPDGAGDRNKWSLRYEDGTTTIGGGLFEAEGVQPITFRGLDKLDLRGTAYVGGDTDGNAVQVAAGLETRAFRIPFFAGTGTSNWIVFGVNAQHQEVTDSQAGDGNLGLLTFRAFLGKAFGWRKSASVAETAARLEAQILKQAPTVQQAQELAARIRKEVPANQRTRFQALFLDTVAEANPGNWEKTVREMAAGTADAITDQATVALYGEASGWQTFSGDPQGSRFKGLATLTADYWFLPKRDDVFLRLRYESGYERALPSVRLNQLMLSVSLRF